MVLQRLYVSLRGPVEEANAKSMYSLLGLLFPKASRAILVYMAG